MGYLDRLFGRDAESLLKRAEALRESGDWNAASKTFAQAFRADAKATHGYFFWRGQHWGEIGHLDKEIAEYDLVLRIDPSFVLGYEARANAYAQQGAYDKAIADCSAAIRLDPRAASALFQRADAYVKMGDEDQALADFDEAVRLDPGDPRVQQRALLYFRKGQYDKAIADCTAAIPLQGKDHEGLVACLLLRSNAYVAKGDHDRALADAQDATRLNPQNAAAHNDVGWAYFNKREFDNAIVAYSTALELDPSFHLALGNRAEAYSSEGACDQAIADLTRILQADLGASDIYLRRATVYRAVGEHEKAAEDERKAEALADKRNAGAMAVPGASAAAQGWESHSTTCENDMSALLDHVLQFAIFFLEGGQLPTFLPVRDGFPPFGAGIGPGGNVLDFNCLPSPGSPGALDVFCLPDQMATFAHVKDEECWPQPWHDAPYPVEAVAQAMKQCASEGGLRAAALVDRVDNQPAVPGEPGFAIRVQMEHVEGAPVTWYVAYRIRDHKFIRGESSKVTGRPLVFAGPNGGK